jgi:hypothetical protein
MVWYTTPKFTSNSKYGLERLQGNRKLSVMYIQLYRDRLQPIMGHDCDMPCNCLCSNKQPLCWITMILDTLTDKQ